MVGLRVGDGLDVLFVVVRMSPDGTRRVGSGRGGRKRRRRGARGRRRRRRWENEAISYEVIAARDIRI